MSKRYENRLLEYLKNYLDVGIEVKKILRQIDPDVRVYIFGSAVRGQYTALSDIDILVVTDRLDKKYDMVVEVYRRIEAPVQLHVTGQEKFINWYLRFIPQNEIVEIK